MDLRFVRFVRFAARIFGSTFLGFASLAFFISLVLLLAPLEISELGKEAKGQFPEKVVSLLELTSPEFRSLTLDQVKTECLLRAVMGIQNATEAAPEALKGTPLTESDLDYICAQAADATDIGQLKLAVVTAILDREVDLSLSKFNQETLEPLYYTYMPISAISFLALFLLSILAFYFSEGEAVGAGRKIFFHIGAYAFVLFTLLAILWLRSPTLVEKQVQENPEVANFLARAPQDQQTAAGIFVNGIIDFISLWVEGVLIHFMLVYLAISIVGAAGWVAFGGISKIMEKLEKGEI